MNSNPAPNFGLLSSVDISGFTGNLLTRSNTVSSSNFTTKVFEDMISFLNGRGMSSGLDLSSQLLAQSAGNFTDWHIGIDANDKVELSATHAFKIKFNSSSTLVGNADILGIGESFVLYNGSATIGAPLLPFKVTSPNEWKRGEIISFSYEIQEVGTGSTTFYFNFVGGAQDLIVACRSRGNGDIDDNSECLESIDISKHPGNDIRYYLNDNGFVTCSYVTVSNITWNNSDFRNRLGFTGSETVQNINNYSVITASHYCPGVLIPSRPYQANHLSVENVAQSRRKIGGGYTSNFIGSYVASSLRFDLDARQDLVDQYRHFTNEFIKYVSKGERINFYQDFGDSRRSLIYEYSNSDQLEHDLIYTTSRNGYEGRIRGSMITNNFDLVYPSRLRKKVPVSLRIEHL